MKQFLLDTNIAIYYMNGKFDLNKKFDAVPAENRFISEITLAELTFGVENSKNPEKKPRNNSRLSIRCYGASYFSSA